MIIPLIKQYVSLLINKQIIAFQIDIELRILPLTRIKGQV